MEFFPLHRILKQKRAPRGLTLIEMLVVLAIIVIITAIALGGQNDFNRTTGLNNAAYDIALTLRQAESYGLSSQTVNGTADAPYGVRFSTGTTYLFFADTYPSVGSNCGGDPQPDCKPGNGLYDSGQDAAIQTYTLNNGYSVSGVCVRNSSGGSACVGSGINSVDITSKRPNTTISIETEPASGTYVSACVKLTAASGEARYISMTQSGQIDAGQQSINAACP